jgi:hypothetical protein
MCNLAQHALKPASRNEEPNIVKSDGEKISSKKKI